MSRPGPRTRSRMAGHELGANRGSQRGYEASDVPVRRIGLALAATGGTLVVILAVLGAFYRFEVQRTLQGRTRIPEVAGRALVPPGPNLLADQAAQRQAI